MFQSRYSFFWLLVVVHLIFWLYGLFWGNPYLKDSHEYLNQAYNLWEYGKSYSAPAPPFDDLRYFSKRPPLYAAVLGFFTHYPLSIFCFTFLQNALSIFNLLLTFHLAASFFNTSIKATSQFIWLIPLLLFPTQLVMAQMVMSEVLFQSLVLLWFYHSLRFLKEKQAMHFLLAHFWALLAVLCKPVFLFLVFILPVFWGVYLIFQKSFKLYFLAALWPMLGYWGLNIYHFQTTGLLHYSSIKYINLYQYNAGMTLERLYGGDSADAMLTEWEKEAATKSFPDKVSFLEAKATEVLKEHTATYGLLHLKGVVNMWLDPGRFDLAVFFQLTPQEGKGGMKSFSESGYKGILHYLSKQPLFFLLYLLLILMYNLGVLLLVLHFILKKNTKNTWAKWLLVAVFLYFSLLTGPVGSARYKVILWPFILIVLSHYGSCLKPIRKGKQSSKSS